MRNLFAYGTLMCQDIMQDVAGCLPARQPGTLAGFERRAVKGECYPGLRPHAAGRVDGVLYRDVPASAWVRLDSFEGDMYLRQPVLIELEDGASLRAETYVIRPQFLARLDKVEWSPAEFMRTGKARFRRHYRGYERLK